MGLDISALGHVRYLGEQEFDGCDDFYHASVNSDFAERADGRRTGFYQATEQIDFNASSYGGYNRWREQLCEMALGVAPQAVWDDPERYRAQPFYDLIDFADNEGLIGPETARRLAHAFAAHDDRARETWSGDEYSYRLYCNFWTAFELAAADGLVEFH